MSSFRPLISSCLAFVITLMFALTAQAQKREITVDFILSKFSPSFADIDIETPNKDEWAKCKIEPIGEKEGYLVIGPAGQMLRRFLDTDRDGKTDQWGYYHDGVEVYREIDTNGNNKIDQVRWLNLGGTRWGIDKNEDGVIDEWKVISPEEVSRMAVRALITQEVDLLLPILVGSNDLETMGIKGPLAEKLLESVAQAKTKLKKIPKGAKVLPAKSVWRRFDSSGPGVIPADVHRTAADLFVIENAMAYVDVGDTQQLGLIVLGELIRVGDVWKLTNIPTLADPEGKTELPSGIVMFDGVRGTGNSASGAAASEAVTPEVAKLFTDLQKLQETPPSPTSTRAEWEKYYKELGRVLVELFNGSVNDAQHEQWGRQLFDTMNAGVQSGNFPQGITWLRQLEKQVKEEFPKLAAFAEYRRTWAEHSVAMREADDDEGRTKVHEKWLKDLEKFTEKYPSSEDTAEVCLQLGFEYEFSGKVEKARGWYQKVSTTFAGTEGAKRADGALLRLGLNGKVLQLTGQSLAGGTIDAKQFRGKALLVLFWDSRSKPAADDLPALKELYEKHRGKGFEVLGISLDSDAATASAYVKQKGIGWPQIHEDGGLESPLARKFGVIILPTMFLVDPDGKVISRSASVDDVKNHLSGEKGK